MTRTNQILALILVVQIVIGIVLFWPSDSETSQAAGPLLAEFEPTSVVNLTLQDGDGNTAVLHKTDQGDWVLPDHGDYPVLVAKVQPLLDKLSNINRNRLIAQNSSSHKRLGVGSDDFERLIEVELANGDTQSIYLGTSAGTSAAHVRLGNEDDVFLTGELAAWEVSPQLTSWVDTTYFSVPSDNIVMLQIENANGVLQFQKNDDTWTLVGLGEDETFDPESITSLLSKVATVRLTEPIGREADPAWGIDDPAVKITVTVVETVTAEGTSSDTSQSSTMPDLLAPPTTPEATATEEPATVEQTYELKLGQALADDGYPLISSESEFYVKVSTATADGFLNVTRADFLVPEPEAAPVDATATPLAGATATPSVDTTATPSVDATATPSAGD